MERFGCWLILLICLASGCRGYQVGNRFMFRQDIRSVHVGIIESNSYRRFTGQKLTEAIVKQIEQQTPMVIAEPATADSFIQGQILRDTKRVQGQTATGELRSLDYGWQIEIVWVDRAGTPLMPRQLVQISLDEQIIPEGGQSLAAAEQQLVERLARRIVGQMEMPW